MKAENNENNNYGLTPEQKAELSEAFKLFDTDQNGEVTTKELNAVLRSLGQTLTESELQTLLNTIDEDGNGTISESEFLAMMASQMNEGENEEEELKQAFQFFDKNGDGHISHAELRFVMNSMGEDLTEDDVKAMMAEADGNKDGFIDFEEFRQIVQRTKKL